MTDEPKIDINLSRIDFPSDNCNFKDLSRKFPEAFAAPNGLEYHDAKKRESILEALSYVVGDERKLAYAAFIAALTGQPLPDEYRRDLIDGLAESYTIYGLAQGPAHAKQLAQSIENQAAAQAAAHGVNRGGRHR